MDESKSIKKSNKQGDHMTAKLKYYQLGADQIFEDVKSTNDEKKNIVEGAEFVVCPHVYPSQKFRTTSFVLKNLKNMVKGKRVCDMGCGPGIVGLFSIINGAKKAIQADINPYAVENAKINNQFNEFTKDQIETYLSDCFDNIPKQKFDLIVFNMPYHNDDIEIEDPLQRAFYDPRFDSIKKFLAQSINYINNKTEIIIAFSNKGDTKLLEQIFDRSEYYWTLWKITNTDQEFDNRIYKLTMK